MVSKMPLCQCFDFHKIIWHIKLFQILKIVDLLRSKFLSLLPPFNNLTIKIMTVACEKIYRWRLCKLCMFMPNFSVL